MSNLLERLRKYKDDRGMMANLRCIFVDSKKHRAWPVLNRLGIPIKDDNSAYISGYFAIHPEEASSGNFGKTCKAIEISKGETASGDNKLTPTERRFQYLLAAERSEIYLRVLRVVRMAKSLGVGINYEQLETDLKYWGNRTKTEWASAFWAQDAPPVDEEDI